jgi:hypothetical protein
VKFIDARVTTRDLALTSRPTSAPPARGSAAFFAFGHAITLTMAELILQQHSDHLHDVNNEQQRQSGGLAGEDGSGVVNAVWSTGTRRRSDPNASHKVIEKRRRDRINKCLSELSKLIPAAYVKQVRRCLLYIFNTTPMQIAPY